jgi:propionate CoA-transferase
MRNKIITREELPQLIPDGSTVSISGAWMLVPDSTLNAIGESFLRTGHPRNLTAVFALCPGGTPDQPGIENLAHAGLLRRVIGGSFPNVPKSKLIRLITDGQTEAYNLPAGMIASWYRSVGAGQPGVFSRCGVRTFVDPRLEGGRLNKTCSDALISVMSLDGQEYLFFPRGKVDVSIIRSTTADHAGNLTMEREPASLTAYVQAAAARASGGIVIAQVEKIVESGVLNPHHVKVPGFLVDHIVLDTKPLQAAGIGFDPSLCGEVRKPFPEAVHASASARWIARRAVQEIREGDVVVLGYGISALVPYLLLQAGQFEKATFAIEQGSSGGLPLTNFGFGSSINPLTILDAATQLELFQGGCFDQGLLSFLQVDRQGRVNVHRIDGSPFLSAGIGGFLDIAASARRLIFMGHFTAGGLEVEASNSEVQIVNEGKQKKFVNCLDHISFDPAHSCLEEALYITERAVFRWIEGKFELIESSPGIDVERDILNQMEFRPHVVDLKITAAQNV